MLLRYRTMAVMGLTTALTTLFLILSVPATQDDLAKEVADLLDDLGGRDQFRETAAAALEMLRIAGFELKP